MKVLFWLIILALQIFVSLSFGIGVYMLGALYDYQGGFDGFFSMTFVQPVVGFFTSAASIFLCLILGLPIRVLESVYQWWTQRFLLPVVIFGVGCLMLIGSFFLSEKVYQGPQGVRVVPNFSLVIAGWFTTLFALSHLFPPPRLMEFVESKFKRK
ncbi:hypothetical protein ACAW74_24395 [Fibrella sp. WM1]|uniref:hypothetical protein n=1 Tax=Fibrella musci TaxID=3242485 RepID=UPI0035213B79